VPRAERHPGSRLLGSVVRNGLGNVAGPVAGLASAPILAQAVGVDGRGAVAAVTAPVLLAAVVAAFGIPDATTYFVARSAEHLRGLRRRSSLVAAASAALTAVAVALAGPALLDEPGTAALLALLAVGTIVPASVVGVLRAHAAGAGLWGLVAIERTAGPVLRLLAFSTLAASGDLDVTSASVVLVVAPLVAGLVYLPHRATEEPSQGLPPRYRTLLGYGARAWFGTLAGAVVMRLDQVLMVPLASAEQLGLYAVAVTVSELPLVATTAIREVLLTADARRQDDRALARAARFATGASAALVLCTTAPWWLPALFGAGFRAALAPMVVLATAVVLGVPGSVAGAALSARGLPHLRSLALCTAALVGTAVLVVCVPAWGAVGGASATLVCNLVAGWTNVAHLTRRTSLRWWDLALPTADDARVVRVFLHRALRGGPAST